MVERLREQLRRDPSDTDVGFLVTLAVRTPLVVYRSERDRLRRLARRRSTARELLMATAAEAFLSQPTPDAGLRRPESEPMEVVEGARGARDQGALVDGDDLRAPKAKAGNAEAPSPDDDEAP